MAGGSRTARLLAASVIPLVLAAAGCASTGTDTQGRASGPPAAPARSQAAPSRTALSQAASTQPASPGTSAAAPAAGAACRTGELKVSFGPGGAAAGTWAALLEFTNQGTAACTMTGWPGVAGVTASGAATPATQRSGAMDGLNSTSAPQVTVQPGQQVGIDISGNDVSASGSCPPPYSSLRVSAPGDSESVTVPAYLPALSGNLPSCGSLAVSPVHPLSDFSFSGQ